MSKYVIRTIFYLGTPSFRFCFYDALIQIDFVSSDRSYRFWYNDFSLWFIVARKLFVSEILGK